RASPATRNRGTGQARHQSSSCPEPLRPAKLIADAGGYLRLCFRAGWRGEGKVVGDVRSARGKTVVRSDLDRLISGQHVVPTADRRHLQATLVDLIDGVGHRPAAGCLTATEHPAEQPR